ncbi:MAG: hypothetical protein ACOCYT_05470 [Chloroflexota bacterium]
MKFRLYLLVVFLLLFGPQPAAILAQTDQNLCETVPTIAYGDTVTGDISDSQFIMGYCFEGTAGDVVTVSMNATRGNLDTLVAISDPFFSEPFVQNDDFAQASGTNSRIEGFMLPADGQYLIVATRYQLDQGTTAGSFTLSLMLDESGAGSTPGGDKGERGSVTPAEPEDPEEPELPPFPVVGEGVDPASRDVEIIVTCDTGERINGGVQFSFINVNPGFPYAVTVVGLDGMDPVVAVETQPGIGSCNDDTRALAGSRLVVPGTGMVEADARSAQVLFTTPRRGFPVNITVGSFDDSPGTFAMIIEGFRIDPRDELDGFALRVPASVATAPLGVYMISLTTQLDPFMAMGAGPGLTNAYVDGSLDTDLIDFDNIVYPLFECDDVGIGACDFSLPLPAGVIEINTTGRYATGQFDSGLVLVPNTTDPLLYAFSSRNSASVGDYAILVLGSVPGALDE